MPTVLRQNGFRVVIYPNDHIPAHVHVEKAGGYLKVGIDTPGLLVFGNFGLSSKEQRQAYDLVAANREFLLQQWERIHG